MVEIIMLCKNGCDKAIMRSENGGIPLSLYSQLPILRAIIVSGEQISTLPIFSPRNGLKTY